MRKKFEPSARLRWIWRMEARIHTEELRAKLAEAKGRRRQWREPKPQRAGWSTRRSRLGDSLRTPVAPS